MSLTGTNRSERPRSGWLVLVSPGRAFIGARDNPRAFVALLVVSLIALATPLSFLASVDFDAFMLREMKSTGQLEGLAPDALDVIKTKVIPAMKVALPIGAVAQRALWCVVIALLGFALLRGTNKELRFSQCLAALALATAPVALHDVLSAVVYLVRDAGQYDPRNPVLSNPAAFLGLHVENDPKGVLLHSLDLFRLWSVWLAGLGLAVVARAKGVLPWSVPIVAYALVMVGRVVSSFAGAAALDGRS